MGMRQCSGDVHFSFSYIAVPAKRKADFAFTDGGKLYVLRQCFCQRKGYGVSVMARVCRVHISREVSSL